MNSKVLSKPEDNTVGKLQILFLSEKWLFGCVFSLPIYLSIFVTALEFRKEVWVMFVQRDSHVKIKPVVCYFFVKSSTF